MTRYACQNPGCPRREPVTAETAPTCYTCGGATAEVCPLGCSTGYNMRREMCSHASEDRASYVGLGYELLAKHGARPVCDCGAILDEVLHADAMTGRAMCPTCVEARLAATSPEAP